MAKGAMNKNPSKPIKLTTRGGKRFRCNKNYATQQQELLAITPLECTRRHTIQAYDKCNPTTRTRASQLANLHFQRNSSLELGTTQLPTSKQQKAKRPLLHSIMIHCQPGAKIDELWSSNAHFSKEIFVMKMAHVTMKNNVLLAQCFLPKSTCGNLIEIEN